MTPQSRRTLLAALVSLAIFGVMHVTVQATDAWKQAGAGQGGLGESPQQLDLLVDAMFRDHVLAFEVLGVLLTAAMIGALVVARPLSAKDDEDNYVQPTPQQLQQSVDQSDVRTHFPEAR